MARTSQHILIPRQYLLVRDIDRPLSVLLHQHPVRVHDSVCGDIRHMGGIEKGHVGGEFAIDGTREPDTISSWYLSASSVCIFLCLFLGAMITLPI